MSHLPTVSTPGSSACPQPQGLEGPACLRCTPADPAGQGESGGPVPGLSAVSPWHSLRGAELPWGAGEWGRARGGRQQFLGGGNAPGLLFRSSFSRSRSSVFSQQFRSGSQLSLACMRGVAGRVAMASVFLLVQLKPLVQPECSIDCSSENRFDPILAI